MWAATKRTPIAASAKPQRLEWATDHQCSTRPTRFSIDLRGRAQHILGHIGGMRRCRRWRPGTRFGTRSCDYLSIERTCRIVRVG
jgi:hypothetical protein